MTHSIESDGARTVVVAGDLTLDWNIAHVASGDGPSATWTAEEQTRISCQRGGAALLGDLVAAATASLSEHSTASIRVTQPEVPCEPPPGPTDKRFHHSFALWTQFEKGVWRVSQFLGVNRKDDGGPGGAASGSTDGTSNAELVVLDDAGLGFRDEPACWPIAVRDGNPRWIILKMARPVAQGQLWDSLLKDHAARLIVLMTIEDLRRTEVQISERLSWERTAQDILWELTHNPRVNGLSRCAHVIISFGTSGAVLLSREQDCTKGILLSEPTVMEGGWERPNGGRMIGSTATLTAAIARQVLLEPEAPDLALGVQSGVSDMRRLYSQGYGTPSSFELRFPLDCIVADEFNGAVRLSCAPIQDPVRFLTEGPSGLKVPLRTRHWTILEERYSDQIDSVAERRRIDRLV